MKRFVVAFPVAIIAFATPARATDLVEPPPATFDWTGFYIGANVGYGFGGHDKVGIKENLLNPTLYDFLGNVGTVNLNGIFGGGQVGYNYQIGHVVLGLEGDIQGSGVDDSTKGSILFDDGSTFLDSKASSDVTWFGTVRGRLGWAFDNVLVYGTGGLAFGGVDYKVAGTYFDDRNFVAKDSFTNLGWTAGGGIEYSIDQNWSVKAEYQYVNLGSKNVSGQEFDGLGDPIPGVKDKTKATPEFHSFRLGIDYHF